MAIRTTVVGSYPIPRWLYGDTSKQTLRDAIAVVLQTQELAGIDLVADGELNRFDPSHPETNGMIDYFVRQLSGVQTDYSMSDMVAFQSDSGMAFRAAPAGVVREAIGAGTLNLPADYDFVKDLTDRPIKFTCTGPHMLSKTLTDRHYSSHEDLCMAVAEVLRCQLADVRADVVQLDEANITGHPEESTWAATRDQSRTGRNQDHPRSASVFRQLRGPAHPVGHMASVTAVSQRVALRLCALGDRPHGL